MEQKVKKKRKRKTVRERIRDWFSRRYGDDELSKFFYIVSLIPLFLSFIPDLRFLLLVALAIIITLVIRSLSSDIEKREKENERFLHFFRMTEADKEARRKAKEERQKS